MALIISAGWLIFENEFEKAALKAAVAEKVDNLQLTKPI